MLTAHVVYIDFGEGFRYYVTIMNTGKFIVPENLSFAPEEAERMGHVIMLWTSKGEIASSAVIAEAEAGA